MKKLDWDILKARGVTPDNLSVGGYLDLRGTPITALPDNLSVDGSLDLRGTQITALPDNLSVDGYLDLSGTQITAHGTLNGKRINGAEEARPYLEEIAKRALGKSSLLDMSVIHSDCGTSHCIAGWAGVLFPDDIREGKELNDSINLLGIEAAKHFFVPDDEGRAFLEKYHKV